MEVKLFVHDVSEVHDDPHCLQGCCFDAKANTNLSYPTCFFSAASSMDLYFLGYGHGKKENRDIGMVSTEFDVEPNTA